MATPLGPAHRRHRTNQSARFQSAFGPSKLRSLPPPPPPPTRFLWPRFALRGFLPGFRAAAIPGPALLRAPHRPPPKDTTPEDAAPTTNPALLTAMPRGLRDSSGDRADPLWRGGGGSDPARTSGCRLPSLGVPAAGQRFLSTCRDVKGEGGGNFSDPSCGEEGTAGDGRGARRSGWGCGCSLANRSGWECPGLELRTLPPPGCSL